MSLMVEGESISRIPFSSYISLRSELSFNPLKLGLPASSGKKIDIIAEKSGIIGPKFQDH